jgi:hypothetical protein
MREKRRDIPEDSLVHYRRAEAIEPDPLRKLTTWMIAAGIIVAGLVLSDAIQYIVRAAPENTTPIMLDVVDLDGWIKDKKQGDQKKDPKVEEPKKTEEKKPDETPDRPVVVQPDPVKPEIPDPAPATSNISTPRAPTIANRGSGPPRNTFMNNRSGGARKAAIGKYGGSPKTENAVNLGLAWLARHQDRDGKWNRIWFSRRCKKGDRCGGAGYHKEGYESVPLDPALTGLALLCFAASDNTHLKGTYKANVAAGIQYLQRIQAKNGRFGSFRRGVNQYMMYNQGIATFALAEIAAMTNDPALQPTLEKAVQFIVRAQQYRSGAWDYTDAKVGRYDTSVTGWQVMALKSAHAAGVEIPPYTLYKVAVFFNRVTLPGGEVIYANRSPSPGRRGQGMVAVGLASAQFLGLPSHSRLAQRQTTILLQHLPDWRKLTVKGSLDSIYYWYYASIAMFQAGGKPWQTWNRHLKKALLSQQRRGQCLNGSWDPPNNFWGSVGGRLYSTTLNILNLQIYYRYLPIHKGGALPTVEALIHVAEGKLAADQIQAIRLLGQFDDYKARDYLVRLAHGKDSDLALEASFSLAEQKHKDAIGPLLGQLRSSNPFVRYRALRAMAPMIGDGLVPVFIECLNDKAPTVSRMSAQMLRQHAKVSFSFEPEAPAAEREAAIRKWRRWWKEKQKGAAVEGEPVWLVVSVHPKKGLVAFSTGKPGRTDQGKQYSVYRGDRYIGRIAVEAVDGAIAIGKKIEQFTSDEFKEGDVVRSGK